LVEETELISMRLKTPRRFKFFIRSKKVA